MNGMDRDWDEKFDLNENKNDYSNSDAEFPKYTRGIINLANKDSGGTRPEVVGQMSEIFDPDEFDDYEEWHGWYMENHSDSIQEATKKIMDMIERYREAIQEIDEDMVEEWVRELVIEKTAEGLMIETMILRYLSDKHDVEYHQSSSDEESKGIDGYLGEQPISVKPKSYDTKGSTKGREDIDVPLVKYHDTDNYVYLYYDEDEFEF
jgi:hypothetical protein